MLWQGLKRVGLGYEADIKYYAALGQGENDPAPELQAVHIHILRTVLVEARISSERLFGVFLIMGGVDDDWETGVDQIECLGQQGVKVLLSWEAREDAVQHRWCIEE